MSLSERDERSYLRLLAESSGKASLNPVTHQLLLSWAPDGTELPARIQQQPSVSELSEKLQTAVKKVSKGVEFAKQLLRQADLGLFLHREQICGCGLKQNPYKCLFQPFLDGWDFTPDVGNGRGRGEIFTPRHIVDQMIVDSGMLPAPAVYDHVYGTCTKKEAVEYVTRKVNEPAVGTANFTSTILWHKIMFANEAARNVKGVLNRKRYDLLVTQAVASMYSNDVDCGNLQTAKWRLLRSSEISTEENVKYWLNYILLSIRKRVTKDQKIDIEQQIRNSLGLASKNWGTADRDKGVMDVLYYEHTGQDPSAELVELWSEILNENVKLFNGVREFDTVTDDFVAAGWGHVEWVWWDFKQEAGLITPVKVMVPLAKQIHSGILSELEAELSKLEAQKTVVSDGLTEVEDFADPVVRKAYQVKLREVAAQKARLVKLDEKTRRTPEQTNTPVKKTAGTTLW